MATTRRYLRLAGTVFANEAAALEARVLGVARSDGVPDRESVPSQRSTDSSTRLSESQPISGDSASLSDTVASPADAL